jgi:hypothetical protein
LYKITKYCRSENKILNIPTFPPGRTPKEERALYGRKNQAGIRKIILKETKNQAGKEKRLEAAKQQSSQPRLRCVKIFGV